MVYLHRKRLSFIQKGPNESKQAGAELGQAQIKLELGLTLIKKNLLVN